MNRLDGHARAAMQERESWGRVAGQVLHSPTGARLYRTISTLILMAFCTVAGWNTGYEDATTSFRQALTEEIATNRTRTVENRCLGFAILAYLDGGKWPLPEWCVRVLAEMPAHDAPTE